MYTAKTSRKATSKMVEIGIQKTLQTATVLLLTGIFTGFIAQVDPASVFSTVAENGLMASLVIFFVWVSWKREARLAERICQLEDYQRSELSRMIGENRDAINALSHKECVQPKKQ